MSDATTLTQKIRADEEIVTSRLRYWARATPDRPFFHYGEEDLTYSFAEFDRHTDSLSGNLAGLGISKGDPVSVFCFNPLTAALAMFGIWKAGGVYAPINFSYTGRLLTYQLTDTSPRLLIVDSDLLPAVEEVWSELSDPPAVIVAPSRGAAVGADSSRFPKSAPWQTLLTPCPAPDITVDFDDPANIIYTSGTTGPAKGVLQPYRWMAQYTFNLRAVLTPDDVIYTDLPMYHVGGAIANVCKAMWAGAEVAVWDRFSPSAFWSRIASRGCTTAILLDVMVPWLMNAPESPDDRNNTLNKAHMQPLPLHHHAFATRFGIDFVTAGFGQTESGAPLSCIIEETAPGAGTPDGLYRGRSHTQVVEAAASNDFPVLRGAEVSRKGLMGVPSPFVECDVLNDRDESCAPEEAGQLCFRPRLPSLFLKGYHGKPEATAKAFANLWFHTGDAALKGDDGFLYFVDRLGDRIRVRGENLSSFQVEDLLNQHPGIQMCAAFGVASREGSEDEIVACVVLAEGADLDEQGVAAFAAETMPKFMRPRYIRIVGDLPRTPTNKVEKYKLRQQVAAELGS